MSNACNKTANGIGVDVINLTTVDGTLAVTVAGLIATLAIDIAAGGTWYYDLWLCDAATGGVETLVKPSDGVSHWQGVTDANGEATISFKNSLPSHTWYLCGFAIQFNASSAITVGA